MKIHRSIDSFKAKTPVLTIGTFDGVHLGHLKVIDQLKQIAQKVNGQSVIFTFYPHPRIILNPHESNLRLLTTLDEKIERLKEAGIDHLLIYPFDKHFSQLTYIEFVNEILLEKMNMHTLVVGHDHKLGKNREGTFDNLVKLSEQKDFKVEKIDKFYIDKTGISSSKIRTAMQNGDVALANKLLGYTFSINGTVGKGQRIGSDIGYPTANIYANDVYKLIPINGVYAITALVEGIRYCGMINIGYRPTVNKNADHRTIEAHLFDFDQNIYQKEITVFLHERVRDEKKFDSLPELKEQLKADENEIREILKNSGAC